MAKVISFYAASPGEGKRTISQLTAKLLGENNQRVLYVELDHVRPSFAKTTGLSHPNKNLVAYMNNIKEKVDVKFEKFTTNSKELTEFNKSASKILPSTIDFLTIPFEYNENTFPNLVENNLVLGFTIQEFITTFVSEFRDSKYDIIILVLPHSINSLFTLPIFEQSDYVFNILTTNPTSIFENKLIYDSLLEMEELNIEEKWKTFINKFDESIPVSQFDNLLPDHKIVAMIPNDPEKIIHDLTFDIGAEKIEYELSIALRELSFEVAASNEKRSILPWRNRS